MHKVREDYAPYILFHLIDARLEHGATGRRVAGLYGDAGQCYFGGADETLARILVELGITIIMNLG